jgi:hypothetical protein
MRFVPAHCRLGILKICVNWVSVTMDVWITGAEWLLSRLYLERNNFLRIFNKCKFFRNNYICVMLSKITKKIDKLNSIINEDKFVKS